jgi:hypothetical protein
VTVCNVAKRIIRVDKQQTAGRRKKSPFIRAGLEVVVGGLQKSTPLLYLAADRRLSQVRDNKSSTSAVSNCVTAVTLVTVLLLRYCTWQQYRCLHRYADDDTSAHTLLRYSTWRQDRCLQVRVSESNAQMLLLLLRCCTWRRTLSSTQVRDTSLATNARLVTLRCVLDRLTAGHRAARNHE